MASRQPTAPLAMTADFILLLDLDGVLVVETAPSATADSEIVLLHKTLAETITPLTCPVVVLTHRSKSEARLILSAMKLGSVPFVAAEDLYASARRQAGFGSLFLRGLAKSWILPEIEALYGISRANIAFIDDNEKNAGDMLAAGIGLALLAPSSISPDGTTLTTFSMDEAIGLVQRWTGSGHRGGGLRSLTPVEVAIDPSSRTGMSTKRASRHAFNAARRVARLTRTLLFNNRP